MEDESDSCERLFGVAFFIQRVVRTVVENVAVNCDLIGGFNVRFSEGQKFDIVLPHVARDLVHF